jgi:hypothetical protein
VVCVDASLALLAVQLAVIDVASLAPVALLPLGPDGGRAGWGALAPAERVEIAVHRG